jgi:hypothetical protein
MVGEESSTRNHFGGVTPLKVHVNFDIPLFEDKIDANDLEKWLNWLEGYYSVKKNDTKKISFMLLKSLPHVKYWWESYFERHNKEESMTLRRGPTWENFIDALKEEFYHVVNYDDQYTR